jgi:hypothetical protein
MKTCKLGGVTEFVPSNPPTDLDCNCDESCEPHRHEGEMGIMCLHDGETDHGHCPNAPWPWKDENDGR